MESVTLGRLALHRVNMSSMALYGCDCGLTGGIWSFTAWGKMVNGLEDSLGSRSLQELCWSE